MSALVEMNTLPITPHPRGVPTSPRCSSYPYPTSELFAGQSPDLLRSCGGDGALAQPAPDAAGSGAATAHLPTSVSSQRRVWPVYRRQLDVQHRQGAAAPLQNERAAPAKKERVPILTFRSCASPQESTPSKRRRRVSSRVPVAFGLAGWRPGQDGRAQPGGPARGRRAGGRGAQAQAFAAERHPGHVHFIQIQRNRCS